MPRQFAEPGDARPAGRLTPRRARIVMLLLALALTGWTFAGFLPRQIDSDLFAGAPICSASSQADCITRTPVTVSLSGQSGTGGNPAEWVDVQGIGSGVTQITTRDAHEDWLRLQPGEQGSALLWRGNVVELDFGAAVLRTPDWPDSRTVPALVRFIIALCFLLIWVGFVFRPRILTRTWVAQVAGACLVLTGPCWTLLALFLNRPAPLLLLPIYAGLLVLGLGGRQVSRILWLRRVKRRTEALIAR